MGRSDSRPGPLPGLCFPPGRWSRQAEPPRRVSQVPRLICPRVLSPSTPESPAVAFAHCFTASVRLHQARETGHVPVALTEPDRIRLRYGSRVRLPGLRRWNCSHPRLVSYLSNEQLQGKLLSAYKISQACLGAPSLALRVLYRAAMPCDPDGRPVAPERAVRLPSGPIWKALTAPVASSST
jgi:hypothetical protein